MSTIQECRDVKYKVIDDLWFNMDTPEEVCNAIYIAFQRRRLGNRSVGGRVRIFLGDTETGKAWEEEHDVVGYIGRSTGPVKVPLLIYNERSLGGGAISTSSIVGIVLTKSGEWLYKHPNFSTGEYKLCPSTHPDYEAAVEHDGEKEIARFKSTASAQRYCDFMMGKRFAK